MQCASLNTAFLQAKSLVAALQSAAVSLQQRTSALPALQRRTQLGSVLRVLQQLHSLTADTLVQLQLSGPSSQQQRSSSNLNAAVTSVCSVCGCWHCCAAPSEQQLQDAASQLEKGLSDWRHSVPEHVQDVITSSQASGERYRVPAHGTNSTAFTAFCCSLLH